MHFADFHHSLHCVTHSRGSGLTIRMSWGVHPRPILTHAQRVCRMYKKVSVSVDFFLLYIFHGRLWEPPKIGQSAVTCSALMPASWGQGIGCYLLRDGHSLSRIDESNKIKDMRVLAKMLEDGDNFILTILSSLLYNWPLLLFTILCSRARGLGGSALWS